MGDFAAFDHWKESTERVISQNMLKCLTAMRTEQKELKTRVVVVEQALISKNQLLVRQLQVELVFLLATMWTSAHCRTWWWVAPITVAAPRAMSPPRQNAKPTL